MRLQSVSVMALNVSLSCRLFYSNDVNMPKFITNKDGKILFDQGGHESDCECGHCAKDPNDWNAWISSEEDPEAPKWPDAEEEVAQAAGCSVDVWQSLSPDQADQRLKKACKSRAAKLQRVSLLFV